jgi:hypothetical protein
LDRSNTPTPGEYPNEELDRSRYLDDVRRVFEEFDQDGNKVITVKQLRPLFTRLENKNILRLVPSSKEMLDDMEQRGGDITMSLDDVYELIPKLRLLQANSEAQEGAASKQSVPETSASTAPPPRTAPLGDILSSNMMGHDALRRRRDGTVYESGSEPDEVSGERTANRQLNTPKRGQGHGRNEVGVCMHAPSICL